MMNILDIINNPPIENFRRAFFDVTGMSISFADEEHKQYNTFYAGSRCEFCRIMNSSLPGLECCIKTSREAGKKAAKSGEALIYTCHAGLKEVVVPIIINGKHIGSIFSGQVMTEEPTVICFEQNRGYFSRLGLNTDEIKREYLNIPVVQSWKLELVSKMLKILVDYIVQTEINSILKEKISKEREKLRSITPYIKSQFVNYIITNNTDKLSEVKDKLIYLGIKKVPNTVFYVKINDIRNSMKNNSDEKSFKQDSIVDLINAELDRMRDIIVHVIDNDSIGIFVHIRDDMDDNLKKETALKIAERLRKLIKDNTVFTPTIGISRCIKNSIGLSSAYKEALNACTYATIIGTDYIIHIDDIQADRSGIEFIHFDSDKLRKNILMANESELFSMYNDVFHQFFSNNKFNIDKVKIFTMEFLNELLNSAIEIGLDSSYVSKRIEYYKQLIGFTSIEDIYSWGRNIISTVLKDLASGISNKNKEIIQKVKKYIDENFNKELNLEDVASFVFLSPNYFGWLFKKETGESFVEYLTKVRVAKSIQLMKNTEEPIYTISEMVGYKDPNYFSQVFKKIEGLRPSAYRKMLAKKAKSS